MKSGEPGGQGARVEELTSRLCDGALDAGEEQELESLLEADPDARRAHVRLLEIERVFRSGGRPPDVAPAVMTAVRGLPEAQKHQQRREQREERIVRGVMGRIGDLPRPRARRWPVVVGGAAVVAAAAMVVLVVKGPARVERTAERAAPGSGERGAGAEGAGARAVRAPEQVTLDDSALRRAAGAGARVVRARGQVTFDRSGLRQAAGAGLELRAGDRLETAGEADATVQLRGGTELELGPRTELSLAGGGRAPGAADERIALARGTLAVRVPPGGSDPSPAIETALARATAVAGATFALAAQETGARIEVGEGRVLFERLAERTTVELSSGQSALAIDKAPPPSAPAPALRLAEPASAVAFDFEDGVLPPLFKEGQVVADGCRSRGCLIGTVHPGSLAYTSVVKLERIDPPLASYTETLVLVFDYWAGTDAPKLSVQIWTPDQRQNYSLHVQDFVRGTWARAEFRFTDLVGHRSKTRPMAPGDRINNLFIFAGLTGGKPFYVDNLRIIDYPRAQAPAATGTRPLTGP